MANIVDEVVVRKSVRLGVPAARAFSVFVEQMETWWPPEHHLGDEGFQSIVVEPRPGGRWYERDAKGDECQWGQVLAWDPPRRVKLSWHLGTDWKFNPDPSRASELEIRFTAEGASATLVELEHSALERHGEGYEQLRARLEAPGAWSYILAKFARVVDGEKTKGTVNTDSLISL
jgi:uncharacterized protein YndB with AHSA1/START domain